jgi:hypothetical protein
MWRGWLVMGVAGVLPLSGQDDAVNFKVPRINDKGVMESVMTGERAKIRPGRPMEVEGLRIQFFQDDGETVKLTVTSPGCSYDARSREAESDQAVEIRGDTFRVEGVGYTYRMEKEQMEIRDKVRVRFWGMERPSPRGRAPEPNKGGAD